MKTTHLAIVVLFFCSFSYAQDKEITTLITNAKIFNGVSEKLIEGSDILIENNLIIKIAPNIKKPKGASVIDAEGHVLTPGFIDSHTHIMWNDDIEYLVYGSAHEYTGVMAAVAAEQMLMRGFTAIRDMGGPSIGLQKAIDDGVAKGPRIFSSGYFISQTSGHGDFNKQLNYQSPYFTNHVDPLYTRGWTLIADGVPEIKKAVRENLRQGVTQIKIMGSGSITGAHDPIDVTEYTLEEMKAIVKEAEKWGTYATVHAYSDESIQNAINAGVKSVEHGLFASAETFEMMKKNNVIFSTQFLSYSLKPEDIGMTGETAKKFLIAQDAAEGGYKRSKELKLKMALGTDILGDIKLQELQMQELVARTKYYTNAEILMQATSINGELLALSGERSPYKEGALGIIKEGAYADLLILKENPLENIEILTKTENLLVIMKDGKIYKNNLDE